MAAELTIGRLADESRPAEAKASVMPSLFVAWRKLSKTGKNHQ